MTREDAIGILEHVLEEWVMDDDVSIPREEALRFAIEALKQEPCEDAIRREAVINALDKHCDTVCEYSKAQRSVMCGACSLGTAFDVIEALPSVQPKAKTGKWISREKNGTKLPFWGRYECSECGECASNSKYCPNCGCQMEGDKK